LILLRQGKISKWFSGIGQEAVSVGAVQALAADEMILPMHRNLGVFTGRNVALERLFAQFQGKKTGFTKGRDRSFHFGTMEHHIVGMISHLGPQMALADGIALGHLLGGNEKATLVFTGDGASSEDVGAISRAFYRLPVEEESSTNASISSSSQITQEDLNEISAFNRINLKVDGSSSDPYKEYEDVNIRPSSGSAATFPKVGADNTPSTDADVFGD